MITVQWVQTAEPKTQGGVYFSNKVTEEATNALLNIGTVILESQTQSRYVVVEVITETIINLKFIRVINCVDQVYVAM